MTNSLYHCGQPATSSCLFDLGLGWRHTIVDEPNFVSPWAASSNALELAFQIGTLACQGTFHTQIMPSKSFNIVRDKAAKLTFNDQIEVFIGLEDSLSMISSTLAHDELCGSHAKPWGWHFASDTWDYDYDDDCYRSRKLNRSHSSAQHLPPSSPTSLPGCISLRTTDAWHHPLPPEALGDGDGGEEPDPDVIPDHANAPRFVRDLMDLAISHNAFNDLDEPGFIRVRTWYLHHRDLQRNLHPRILEFEEDWRRWEMDIGLAWRDFIHPNEEIQIHVVYPDPYKGYMTRLTHADLVISQGHWLPRYSSVISVHKTSRTHEPLSFALASSLGRRVSGVQLADNADVLQWCNHPGSRCTVTYAWHEIPFSMRPTHEVLAGQSFVIQIVDANPTFQSTGCPQANPTEEQQALPESDHGDDYDMPDQGDRHDSYEPPGFSPSGSSIHSSDLSLLIYRLEAPDAHCFSQGDNYAAILNSAIRACRLPRRLVRCFHFLAVCPVGVEPEHETAIILQSVGDISAGSDEKLVLVDTEIHFHPLRNGLVVPAAHNRKVMRVNPHMHRNQLLLLTGLFDYCQLQMDQCTILHNHVIWAAQDRRVLDISHGHYFRIVIPPPQEEFLDTELPLELPVI